MAPWGHKSDRTVPTGYFSHIGVTYSAGRSSIYLNGTLSGAQREGAQDNNPETTVGRRKVNGLESRVESAWFQRLKLKCDELVSSFAFNFKLRPYRWVMLGAMLEKGVPIDFFTGVMDEVRMWRVRPAPRGASNPPAFSHHPTEWRDVVTLTVECLPSLTK